MENNNPLPIDTEPELGEPIQIDKVKGPEPISFKECVKINLGNFSCEIYSNVLIADQLASIVIALKQQLGEDKKTNGGYLG